MGSHSVAGVAFRAVKGEGDGDMEVESRNSIGVVPSVR